VDLFRPSLEQAAQNADAEAARKCIGELSHYLDRVEVIFD